MKLDLKSRNFKNGIAKAKRNKRFVAVVPGLPGVYRVNGSKKDSSYVVSFWSKLNQKNCACECLAYDRGLLCYHVAAALIVHSGLVRCGSRPPAPSFD